MTLCEDLGMGTLLGVGEQREPTEVLRKPALQGGTALKEPPLALTVGS